MLKRLKLKNYGLETPDTVLSESVTVDIHNFIKHYLDEHVPNYDREDRDYYIKYFKKRLLPGNYFAFEADQEMEITDIKRDFSTAYGRALSRSLLDVYCNIPFFDFFQNYLEDRKGSIRHVSGKYSVRLHNSDLQAPAYLAQDAKGSMYPVETRGRSTNYYRKELISYIGISRNITFVGPDGESPGFTCWTVPSFIAFGNTNSACSLVRSEVAGKGTMKLKDYSIFRAHYRRVMFNMNHVALANHLHGSLERYGDHFRKLFLVGSLLLGNQIRKFILEPITFDGSAEVLYYLNYPDNYFASHTRRRNLVYGLDLDVALLLSEESRRGNHDYSRTISKIDSIDINSAQFLGLSNDGTVITSLDNFRDFEFIEV